MITVTDSLRYMAWEPHPTEIYRTSDGHTQPKAINGPHITPRQFEDGKYRSQGCAVIGWCASDKHDYCWQASDAPPIDHDLDDCEAAAPGGHPLRCRCDCHTATAHDKGHLF